MPPLETVRRFDDRVDDYVRFRPGYAPGLVDWLHAHGVDRAARVADIGAGTGISSRMFLDRGHAVVAVEPNAAMREAAQEVLGRHALFRCVDGSAEATTLDDACCDLVFAAQAFHWFDRAAARREWQRILATDGFVAIVQNTRRIAESPFASGYDELVRRYGRERGEIDARRPARADMPDWFGTGRVAYARLENPQRLDLASLRGRLLSSSTTPREGDPARAGMLAELERLFEAHAVDGTVGYMLDTEVHFGRLVD